MLLYFQKYGPTRQSFPLLAVQRLRSGFRPATMNQYTRMFRDFLYFLEKAQISPFQVNTVIILAFMEHLHQKGLSQAVKLYGYLKERITYKRINKVKTKSISNK